MKIKKKTAFICGLSAAYVFGMIALASCGTSSTEKVAAKKELARISADTISYDGYTLSWGQVSNADGYEVTINGTPENVGNALTYSKTVKEDADITVRAIASPTNDTYVSSSEATEKKFTYKGQLEVTLDEATSTYNWTEVSGAAGYAIKENGSLFQGYQQETSYALASVLNEDGNYSETFQAKAVFEDENCFSLWSEVSEVTVLSTPQGVTYNGRVLEWDEVKGAESYTIKLYKVDADGNETVVKQEKSSDTSFVYNAFGDKDGTGNDDSTIVAGSYSISISADSSVKNVLSSGEERFNFSYVDPISEIAMTNGEISWEPITNADYYVLEINGTELDEKIYDNKYAGFDRSSYESFTVRVTPRKDDGSLYSGWSSRSTFTVVETPYITWTGTAQSYSLDWSKNADGTTYNSSNSTFEVYIKEYGTGNIVKTFTTNSTSYSGNQLLEMIGDTKGSVRYVQVKAVKSGEEQNDSDSLLSEPIYFYNLNDPSAYTISTKDIYTEDLTTTLYFNDIQIKDEFEDYPLDVYYRAGVNSVGGNYNTDAAVSKETTRTITLPANEFSTGETVKISYKAESPQDKTMLTNADGERTVFLFSDTTVSIDCERLAQPVPSLNGTVLKWDIINKASSYQLLVTDMDGKQVGDIQVSVGTKFNIANLGLPAGQYDIQVSALGNGNITFSSLYSNPVRFTQLATPTNVRVEGTGDSRKITWDIVDNCKNYTVMIGTSVISTDQSGNSITITQDELSINGNTVSVIANGDNDDNTLTSLTSSSIVLYKLETPTNVIVSDSGISWQGVDAYMGKTVGYEVWIGDECISGTTPLTTTSFDYYTYDKIKTSYDAFNLDVQIRAVLISDDTQIFSSERTSIANITRLASPKDVTMNPDTGEITWSDGDVNLTTIASYQVKIEYSNHPSLTETYLTTSRSFTPNFNSKCVGDTVTITVRAIGNGVDYVSSNPYIVEAADTSTVKYTGCVCTLEKLATLTADQVNAGISYTVDEKNHIVVVIDESKLGEIKGQAYGIKVDGILNSLERYNTDYYTLDSETGLYTYTLSNGSTATYDAATKVYRLTTRYSSSGTYDIDVKVIGDNFSGDPRGNSDTICYVDSEYSGVVTTLTICGEFVETDLSIENNKLNLLNKPNAVKYEYTIEYISMGKAIEGTKGSGTIAVASGNYTSIDLADIPANATGIRVTVRVLGDNDNYVFDSIKYYTTDLLFSNIDLTKNNG